MRFGWCVFAFQPSTLIRCLHTKQPLLNYNAKAAPPPPHNTLVGRGRWAVSQKRPLIPHHLVQQKQRAVFWVKKWIWWWHTCELANGMQVDASSRKLNSCVQTCVGWPNGLASLLASARKSSKKPFQCYSARCNLVLVVNSKTFADLRWVAKRWQTCVDLRANLISTKVNLRLRMARILTSIHDS